MPVTPALVQAAEAVLRGALEPALSLARTCGEDEVMSLAFEACLRNGSVQRVHDMDNPGSHYSCITWLYACAVPGISDVHCLTSGAIRPSAALRFCDHQHAAFPI